MSRLREMIKELCPAGVEYRKLKEIFDTRNGYTPSKSNDSYWENGTIPWFRMEDIRENGHILSDSIQHVNSKAIKGDLFPANSIIVATSATVGEHALITVPSLANQRFTYLMLKHEFSGAFDIKFLFYYCYNLDLWCLSHLNQGSFPSVDMKQFAQFEIPVPPLPIQNEIVKLLDNFTELTAELLLRKKQYNFYRDSLLNFSQNASSVEWKTLREVSVHICSGGTPTASNSAYYSGDIPWLRTQEVDWTDIYDTDVKISEEGLRFSSARWIPENCVIVAMYGATAAKAAINRIPLTTNQACCNLEINENVAAHKYVYHWVCSQYENLKAKGQGSQSNINKKIIEESPIPIPPLEVQQKIVSILDRFDTLCNDLTQGLPAEIAARKKQYEYYRDKLLTFRQKGA